MALVYASAGRFSAVNKSRTWGKKNAPECIKNASKIHWNALKTLKKMHIRSAEIVA